MKKVKFIPMSIKYDGLTGNKVYDVIRINQGKSDFWNMIVIINDHGKELAYDLYDYHYNLLFEDVTHTYRNEIIDDILD